MTRRWSVIAIAFALMALAPLFLSMIDQMFYMNVLTRVVIIAIALAALDFILGYGGMVSFGQAMFVAIGAYVCGLLAINSDASLFGFIPGTTQALISWPLAMIVSGLIGALVGVVALRTRGIAFLMITLAFAQLAFFGFSALSIDGKGNQARHPRLEMPLIDLRNDHHFYYLALALLAAVVVGLQLLVRTPFGRIVRGAKLNQTRMEALGHRPLRQQVQAFALAAAITGLAGALTVSETPFIEPELAGWPTSGSFLVMVALGGQQTIIGALFGAAAFLGLEEAFASRTADWRFYVGIGLIAFVLFARRGIATILLAGTSDE